MFYVEILGLIFTWCKKKCISTSD